MTSGFELITSAKLFLKNKIKILGFNQIVIIEKSV